MQKGYLIKVCVSEWNCKCCLLNWSPKMSRESNSTCMARVQGAWIVKSVGWQCIHTFGKHCQAISCLQSIDLIVNRPLIAHLSLYTRLKPTYDKKIDTMGLVYIFNQWAFNCKVRGPWFKPWWTLIFHFFSFFKSNQKMIEILTKISAKIIVVENREPYYFVIICKCKEVPLSLFSYQILASSFDYRWAV